MRISFLVVLLAGAVFYTYIAYTDLSFVTRTGRLGPGFFPRIVGSGIIVMTLWTILEEMRKQRPPESNSQQWRDVALLISLALGYAVLLRLFGGFVATVIFLGVTLSLLNRGRTLNNVLVAILLPIGIYALLDKALNASMPPALFDFIPI